jgi:hypothetical protein
MVNVEPEIKEIISRLKLEGNTTCTDDIITILGNKEEKVCDMSQFASNISHKSKIMLLGREAFIRKLRDKGIYVWIHFSDDGHPIIELDKILQDSREYAEKLSAMHE